MSRHRQSGSLPGKFTTEPKFRRGQFVMPTGPWRVLVPRDKHTGEVVVSVAGTTWTLMAPEAVLRRATAEELRAAGIAERHGDAEEMS